MADFSQEIAPLLQAEGGFADNPSDRGGKTKYGISQKAYPKLDIERLTPDKAAQIYKRDYWDKIGGDRLPPQAAAVAFDAAVNHGVGTAKALLAYSGGDPGKMIEKRRQIYDRLAASDPSQRQFHEGWMNRLQNLAGRIGDMVISPAQADDAPIEELVQKFHAWKAAKQQQPGPDMVAKFHAWKAAKDKASLDPTEGMSTTDKVLAGVGKAMTDTGQGLGQMVGLVSPEDVSEKRRLDKSLMDTTAGKVGDFIGNVATTMPTLAIPGANTLKGAAAIGAGLGAIQPAESVGEVAQNAGLAAGANAAGVGLGKLLDNRAAQNAAASAVPETAKKAIEKGFVIPPTQVKPTFANRALEGFAGKLTTAQNASAKNQEVSNALARKAIGAQDLTEEGIAAVRAKANASYGALSKSRPFMVDDAFKSDLDNAAARTAKFQEDFPALKNAEVDSLIESLKSKGSFNADTTVEAIKRLRQDSSANKSSLDASKKELGRVQAKIAASLEDLIDRNLEKSGDKQLLGDYREARQTLAKTHQVEKAVDRSTGNINANKLAAELQKGKPLTGGLRDIAEFAQAYPKAAQNVSKMGSLPGSSPLDFAAIGGMAAATQNPLYLAALLARPAARKAALSKAVQNGMVKETGRKAAPNALKKLLQAGGTAAALESSGQQ